MGATNKNCYNAIPTLKYLRRALGGQGTGITRHSQRWARPMSTVKPSRHGIVRAAPKRPRVAGSAEVGISISRPSGALAGKDGEGHAVCTVLTPYTAVFLTGITVYGTAYAVPSNERLKGATGRVFSAILEKDRKRQGSNPDEEIPDSATVTDDAGISYQADIDAAIEARNQGQSLDAEAVGEDAEQPAVIEGPNESSEAQT
ncbi:hypothetical protein B0H13DRAFT_1904225 [Mycena leptocephala]|nr:hypothetical protein B0H13DRAFT_1904225 [Mycena leptocephala]